MDVVFDTMHKDEERWMMDYSVLVGCMNVALRLGGNVSGVFPREFYCDN
jgi:hypothetical protein